ncbi:MAG TPA: dihydrolipoamide acetyltransferase family protein [Acidimicrobiia bacterium]
MPVITASGEEAVVTAWFVDEGGSCKKGQLLAEVQAEKISAEVEAPGAGYVVDRVPVNDPVEQGSRICRIVETEGPVEPAPEAPTQRQASAPRVLASPSAKRVARELAVDLATVTGTGPGGRVTETDVRDAAGDSRQGGDLRAVIARNMRRSRAETAAVTLHSTVDLGEEAPVQITATIVRAVAQTLPRHPHLNGRRDGDAFLPADKAQISLAIQTEAGLVAPVVRDAADRTVEDVASGIGDLARRAEAGQLSVEDYEDGTFTVTNLGAYGVDGFTPIINLPQVAILGVGAVRRVAVVDDQGNMSARYQVVLSLTFDHAFVDGAPAADFLHEVGEAVRGTSD